MINIDIINDKKTTQPGILLITSTATIDSSPHINN